LVAMRAMSIKTWASERQAPDWGLYGVYVTAHWSPEFPRLPPEELESELGLEFDVGLGGAGAGAGACVGAGAAGAGACVGAGAAGAAEVNGQKIT